MRLVIAEKRSVAFAIAQALGDVRQGDGYVSAGGALISWAQGHLVELSDPEEYTDMPWSAHKWTMESLPIDPKSWRWRLSGAKGAVQRYRSLVELLRSDKVTELVNACDPDREDEAIFRRVLMASKVSKPSLRLWVASLDEQAIRDAWKRMRPESDYDGLADAADARAKADWLVGMNASRAHTLAWHRSLSLGRVRTPTLNMGVQRDLAIESHKPTPFWRLIVPMDGWTLESGKIEDRGGGAPGGGHTRFFVHARFSVTCAGFVDFGGTLWYFGGTAKVPSIGAQMLNISAPQPTQYNSDTTNHYS